ncbi:MAG: hypothetical protein ABIN05_07430 [candidate division WOR-3 bacterium]
MKKKNNSLFFLGLTGIIIVGSFFIADLFNTFFGNKNIYWTGTNMMIPYEKSANDFEIFLRGELLQKSVTENKLVLYDKNETFTNVTLDDLSYRLNNYYKVKSANLTKLIFTSFFFGIFVSIFIVSFFVPAPVKELEKVEQDNK